MLGLKPNLYFAQLPYNKKQAVACISTNRVRGCAIHPTAGGINFKTDVHKTYKDVCGIHAFLPFKPLF